MTTDLDDPTRDAAIRALCDFAEQPHPGRAGEAIDALERHLRTQPPPAPERQGDSPHQVMTAAAGDGGTLEDFEAVAEETIAEKGWPSRDRAVAYLTSAIGAAWHDGESAGLESARSDAEAMRRVLTLVGLLCSNLNEHTDLVPLLFDLKREYDALPASLRPPKGTP